MFKKTALAIAAVIALSPVALANADYGMDATSPAECTTEFPLFEKFEDGSSGCFATDTPGLQEWEPGEFEEALAKEGWEGSDEPLREYEAAEEEAKVTPAKAEAHEPADGRSARPSLPHTGN